jgi:hypothetical protein
MAQQADNFFHFYLRHLELVNSLDHKGERIEWRN